MRFDHTFRRSGTTDPSVTEREIRNRETARKAAAEGFVLLKNEGVLPLSADRPLALLGPANHIIKGGTGSGDVNQRIVVQIDEALREAGMVLTSESWLRDFDKRYRYAREDWKQMILGPLERGESEDVFAVYTSQPFRMPDGRVLESADVEGAAAAVYVISRVAGEAKDRAAEPGDYELTEKEMADLVWLNDHAVPVVLLLNAGAPVQLADVSKLPFVKGILVISQPGQEGGHAVADVLLGKVTPSGKLTATWAVKYADYPNAESFSYLSGDVEKEYYTEDIYVGYRYFDSFMVEPLYPFGFGLSYTDFLIEAGEIRTSGSEVIVSCTVTNTGRQYSGREVVQLYVTCPQEGLPKEYQRLAGFVKTALLSPGETWQGEIRADAKAFASFDEERPAWMAEAGLYGLWLGNSSAQTKLAGILKVEKDAVIEMVRHICPQKEWLPAYRRPEDIRKREERWHRQAEEAGLAPVIFVPETEKRPVPEADEITREARRLAARIPLEELIPLFYGEISKAQGAIGASGVRVPGSAAETTGELEEKYGIPGVVLADGPAGLRLNREYRVSKETGELVPEGFLTSFEGGFLAPERKIDPEKEESWYQFCTAFPVGTLLAQTFDPALVEEVGRAVAVEMEEYHVNWWLAPGMNIQRNPLCGRNFEYYSEDPLLSGVIAAAMTDGVQSVPGMSTTIKHFACNNQEDNRMGSDSILSERALREIYLRGFEIAVKKSHPMCIMTSYNLINGVHAANCRDLCTGAAREEWGFTGVIMTDWTTTFPVGGSVSWKCIEAGNDLIMPGYPGDDENIREALRRGDLKEETMRECAARILDVILRTGVSW